MGERYLKRIVSVAIVLFVLFTTTLNDPVRADAGSTYWLYGEGSGAGGNATLYYDSGKFHFGGRWAKGSSIEKSAGAYQKKKNRKMMSMSKKKGSNCKIGEEDYNEKTGKVFMRYTKFTGWYGDSNIAGITCWVQIKNNKVVKVVQGA